LTTFAEHGTIRNEIVAIKTEKKVSPSPSLMVCNNVYIPRSL
jgi:hypothetical protein